MRAVSLTVAIDEEARDLPGFDAPGIRWVGPIAASWPRTEVLPHVRIVGLRDLPAFDATDRSTVLAVVAPGAGEDRVRRVVERLSASMAGGIVLADGNIGVLRTLEAPGVLIEPHNASPRHLASCLFALAARQASIDELNHELRHMRISSGGLVGQMTQWHHEMHLAAAVQRELLPRELPKVDGIDAGVLFRPAGYVSGDIYDLTVMPDGRVAFFIADAVGHGVPAALLTMVIGQSLARTHTHHGRTCITEPAGALARLNESLCNRQFHSPRFATGVYGLMDAESGDVTLAVAGHPPPLRMGASIRRVEAEGPLLGVFPDAQFEEVRFTLEPGETLMLYSDGFETAFPRADAGAGEERKPNREFISHMARLLRDRESGATLADFAARLGDLLDGQFGSLHQLDDLTALAISRCPVAQAQGVAMAQAA